MENLKRYKDWIELNEKESFRSPGYYTQNKNPNFIYRKNTKGKWEFSEKNKFKFIPLQGGDTGIKSLEKYSMPIKLRILFVGDSNTASTRFGKFYGWWVKYNLGDNVIIDKIAKGGQGTLWMIENLKKHLSEGKKYDVISILGGSNDIWNPSNSLTLEEVKNNIKPLVEIASRNSSRVVVISPPSKEFYPPVVNKNPEALGRLKITEELREWEKITYGKNFIDFNFITSSKGGSNESYFEKDRRHLLTEPKHKQLGNLWIDKIYWG